MIVNRQKLERFHKTSSSKLVLSALSTAIDSVRPDYLIRHAVKFSNGKLMVSDIYGNVAKLPEFNHVYIVGAGKAALGMASAMRSLLNNKIAAGAITIPYGIMPKRIKSILITEASHPIPDDAGIKGTRRILSILRKAEVDDLVVFLISGGGSALMPLPAPGISL
ncbi:MAG: DUF4147 domain-containing protein, partial [Nitrososphaera sp.]